VYKNIQLGNVLQVRVSFCLECLVVMTPFAAVYDVLVHGS